MEKLILVFDDLHLLVWNTLSFVIWKYLIIALL